MCINFQAYSLGLLRSDYLAHMFEDNSVKQVEINTIASSFGGISTHMMPLQRYFDFFHNIKLYFFSFLFRIFCFILYMYVCI